MSIPKDIELPMEPVAGTDDKFTVTLPDGNRLELTGQMPAGDGDTLRFERSRMSKRIHHPRVVLAKRILDDHCRRGYASADEAARLYALLLEKCGGRNPHRFIVIQAVGDPDQRRFESFISVGAHNRFPPTKRTF
jgi:hypothetical protein